MKNLRIYASLADGSSLPLEGETGREMIAALLGDDVRPPPEVLVIEAETPEGHAVSIRIPNDEGSTAHIAWAHPAE